MIAAKDDRIEVRVSIRIVFIISMKLITSSQFTRQRVDNLASMQKTVQTKVQVEFGSFYS